MTPAVSAASGQLPAALPASVLADGTGPYDVAVIGFGIAGGCAALEAARAGARVLLLERAAVPGGTTCLAGGHFYLGGGTPVQLATGHQDSPEEMYKYLVATAKDPEHDKIRAYCAGSVEHFGWLESLGFQFERSYFAGKAVIQPGTEGLMFSGNEQVWPFRELARPAPRGHKVPVPGDTQGARLVVDLLRDRIAETSAEVRYETGATNLVTDEAGGVAGLAWRSFAETGLVRAGATVIAAGGFVMNPDMVAEYTPALGGKLITLGSSYDDGLGIRLGMSVAAGVRHMDEPFITAPCYPPAAADHRADRQLPRPAFRGRGLLPRTDLAVRAGAGRLRGVPHRGQRACAAAADAAGAAARRVRDRGRPGAGPRPAVRLAGRHADPVQRLRRPRPGPGLPQERPVAGGPGPAAVGGLRPAARPGPVRRVHPRRPAHHGSTGRCGGTTARSSRGCTRPGPARRTSPRTARATAQAPSSARGRSSAAGQAGTRPRPRGGPEHGRRQPSPARHS